MLTPRITPPAHRRGRGPPRAVANGHKFSAVRRLSWRLLDRLKNLILPTPLAFGAPLWVTQLEFRTGLLEIEQKTRIAGLPYGVVCVILL